MTLTSELKILLYVPNVIGYVRVVCLAGAWWLRASAPELLVVLYALQAVLDGLDGWAARRLHQCSTFGAWLDVVVDNTGRAMLWSLVSDAGWLVSGLEWLCFVCNSGAGSQWKSAVVTDGPLLCRKVMAHGFRTRWGVLAIAGLHVLPIYLFVMQRRVSSDLLALVPSPFIWLGLAVLVVGRVLCALVELWCIVAHVRSMLRRDAKGE